jgi:uncharacterized protein (DUF58 family)
MSKYLTPETIARLGNLQVVARMVVEGVMSGFHKSPHFGFNVEYAEHRAYRAGDELRHVDWKYFAKTDEYFVKQFEESTSLRSFVLLDRSRSMDFGGGPLTKLDLGRYLAASLSYLMIHQQDKVGLATFSEDLDTIVPPNSNPSQLHRILATLEADPGEDRTDLGRVMRNLAARLKRRHLIVVISDLLDEPENMLAGVCALRHQRHDVVLFQTLAPEELDFPYDGVVEFEGLEEQKKLELDTSLLRAQYLDAFQEFRDTVISGARSLRVDTELFRTDQSLEEGLGRYLTRRVRGRG